MLKPQDVVIVLKIVAKNAAGLSWNFASLAKELFMSSSEVHAGFKRAVKATLINPHNREPNFNAICELIVHGLRYVFPPELGELTRGLPTSYAMPPLANKVILGYEVLPVWPYEKGTILGQTFLPLYKSVPQAALLDPLLYELLALVDAIRGGRARERNLAIKELKLKLGVGQ